MDRPDTSIQNHIQRTCQFVIALMLVVGCCPQSSAQETFPQNVYTIIGDVQSPATYEWARGQTVSLQMVLQRANALGPSGTAIIRKANQPNQAIPVSVWANRPNRTFLTPRDTIVWRSVAGSNPHSGNVVFLTDQGPKLQAIPVTGVGLTTVLQAASLPFDQPVIAHRNGWGNQLSFSMNSGTPVLHGDVLDIRSSMTRRSLGPTAATQDGNQLQRRAVKTVSNAAQQGPTSPFGGVPNQRQTADVATGLHVPASPGFSDSSSEMLPGPLANADAPLQIPNSTFDLADGSGFRGDLVDANADLAKATVSSGFGSPQGSTDSAATLQQLANEALNPTAPAPALAGQESGPQTFLSGVFLFGLVLAIGLITVGIVRTRQEQRLHDQMRVGTVNDQIVSSLHDNQVNNQMNEQGFEALEAMPTDFSKLPGDSITQLPAFSVELPAESNSINQPQNNGPGNESIGIGETNIDTGLENCPVLSAGLDEANSIAEEDIAFEATPITGTALDSTENRTTIGLLDEISNSTKDAADNQLVTETSVDLTPWLDGNSVEIAFAEEDSAEDGSAEIGEVPIADDQPDDTITLSLPDTTDISSDADSEGPILQLPDVDALRDALTLREDVSSVEGQSSRLELDPIVEDTGHSLADEADPLLAEIKSDGSIVEEPVVESVLLTDEVDSPQTIQNQEDIMAHPPMTQAEARYLEDLIQNRLPMELSQTQLPLRISLFGKPEGPRRLRIDAAHSTIAPPKMARAGSRSKRRETVAAVTTDTVKQEARQAESPDHSVTTQPSQVNTPVSVSDAPTQSPPASDAGVPRQSGGDPQSPTSGLDKALNFLEEQSKS